METLGWRQIALTCRAAFHIQMNKKQTLTNCFNNVLKLAEIKQGNACWQLQRFGTMLLRDAILEALKKFTIKAEEARDS